MKRGIINFLVIIVIFLVYPLYAIAAGGGGGSSGLGFGARDSVFILVSQDYSAKFSLKNGTKYDLTIDVDESNVSVTFGNIVLELILDDNFVDLNNNGFADINFNLVKFKGKRADVRIINAKEQVALSVPKIINEKPLPKEEKEVDDEKIEMKEDSEEEEFMCGNLGTLGERVSCRLELEEDEQEEELELYYLPEECRALSGSDRGICIARYKSVQTCWKFPIGAERVSCAKRALKLETIQEEKETCDKLTGQEKSICVKEIKNKVYNIIKWKFYDLEERAEDFMKRGFVDEESVLNLIVKLEQKKIEFNEATTKEERKNIILDVRNDWKEFIDVVRENLRG